MAEDTTRTSNRKLNSGASEYNAISFMIEQGMKGGINTCIPVRVDSCTKPGPNGAAGYVTATPLVMQRGADGNSLAPVSLPQLPFFRLYAGTAAVVIDPQPGDVGLAIFSQQDASNLEAGKNEPVQAGSFRSFDMSDGFYVGGFLGNVPDVYAELEQSTGINIKTPTNTITIGRDDGTITIHADTIVNVEAPIAKCTGDVEIAGTLKTGGMATFQQGLQTAAGTNASIGGSLTAANNISAGGDFSGSGGMSLGGSASIGGTLDATGAASFGSTVDVTGAATFCGTVDATGAATLTADGDATFNGALTSTGDAEIGGDLDVTGALTAGSISTAGGGLTIDGDITASGDISTYSGTISTTVGDIVGGNINANDIIARGYVQANKIGVSSTDIGMLEENAISAKFVHGNDIYTIGIHKIAEMNYIRFHDAVDMDSTLNVTGNIRSEGSITAPTIQQDPSTP